MLRFFQDSFIFVEATSSHFFRVTISTQQFLSQNINFFTTAAFFEGASFSEQSFFRSYFFRIAFFRAKILQSSHSLRIGSYLGPLLFGTSIFLAEEQFRIKASTEELLFQSRYFSIASTFSRKLLFGKSQYFRKAYSVLLFLESYLFRVAMFSKDVAFYSIIFRRAVFLQHTVSQLRFFSTAALLICQY